MVFWITQIIIGAVIGALIASFATYKFVRRIRAKSRVAMVAALETEVEAILQKSVIRTHTDRALVLKLHNGGDKLLAGSRKYASVLHEAENSRMPLVKTDFQRYLVDNEYLLLMQKIEADRVVILETDTMPEGVLKRRYEMDNIRASVVFWIRETEKAMYYGSFTTTQEPHLLIGKDFPILESKINRLRNMYAKADKQGVLF